LKTLVTVILANTDGGGEHGAGRNCISHSVCGKCREEREGFEK